MKQTQTPEEYDGDGPKNVRSDISDQEEDEESEECPVSISKFQGFMPGHTLFFVGL